MEERLYFPAIQRNKQYIGDILSKLIPEKGFILEIGSGSGEHGVTFQNRFPEIIWQTSDPDRSHRKSINAWIDHYGLTNKMPQSIDISVEQRPWPLKAELISRLKGVICINVIHICPWSCTKALFEESATLLREEGFLFLYGPFKRKGSHTSESNALFDQSLKAQNKNWGVRDIKEVEKIAIDNGFHSKILIEMPANNLSLIFCK